MIRALIIFLVVVVLPGFARGTDNSTPSHEQIKKWWRAEYPDKPDEEMEVDKLKSIQLKSGEKAYLAAVRFPRRGHCCWSKALLIRPELKKARELDEVYRDFEIHDLDNDNISEIVATDSYWMGGQSYGKKTILYFNGWDPVVVHTQYVGNNDGACGGTPVPPCHYKEVTWTFRHLDDDEITDLVELTIFRYQNDQYQWKWVTETNSYLLKDKKFIPATPDTDQSEWVQQDEIRRFFCNYPVDTKDYVHQNGDKPYKIVKGEVLFSSSRSCLGLGIPDGNSAKIVGIRLRTKGRYNINRMNFVHPGHKVEVKCTYDNGFLYGQSIEMLDDTYRKLQRIRMNEELAHGLELVPTPSRKSIPKPTKKDCSKYIQLLTKADDEKDMRAKAREYIYCLIRAGLPLEKANIHVTATIETLNALQKTSITPEKLQMLGPVLSGKMNQGDKVGETAYPPKSISTKDVSNRDEDQFHPNSKLKSEKQPLTQPAVVADISEIKISKENLRKGTLIQLDNVSDYDLMVSVKFPTESLVYTAIVRKKEQTKVPYSKWNRILLKFHDSVLLVIIADTDQHRLKKLNSKKIDVSVWKGEEYMQGFSIPIRVSQDLLGPNE